MGEERGELAAGFAGGAEHERDKLSVKPGFTNKQTGGNRDAYPAVFEDVDGQTGAARNKFANDAQGVSHARKGGFARGGVRVALEGKNPDAKRAIFLNPHNKPPPGKPRRPTKR